MFRDRGDREVTKIQKDLQPYTAMTTEYEILDRLHGAELELTLANKHLITSNDRYQFSVGRLMVARTKVQLATAIASSVTEPNAFANMQDPALKAAGISAYLKATFESSNEDIEEADRIASIKGFNAGASDKSGLVSAARIAWPDESLFTPALVQGSVRALDTIASNILVEAGTTVRAPLLPNNFKQRLNQQFTPILAEVAAKQKAIERARSGSARNIYTPEMLRDIQHDVMACIELLSTTSLWIASPYLFDSYFDLKKPLDELHGPSKPFNPKALGGSALPAVVEKPRSIVPAKPFNPDVLAPPVTSDPQHDTTTPSTPPLVKKEFNPDILAAKPRQSHPFDPSVLRPKE